LFAKEKEVRLWAEESDQGLRLMVQQIISTHSRSEINFAHEQGGIHIATKWADYCT